MSLTQRSMIMRGSAYADGMFNGNQDAAQSYMHMMTAEGLSRAESLAKFREYMKERMGKYNSYTCNAKRWEAKGDGVRASNAYHQAAFQLGMAMHPIMDSTSPAHTNLRYWDAFADWQWADHGPWPWSDEHIDNLTPDLEWRTTTIMRNILDKYGSEDCECEG